MIRRLWTGGKPIVVLGAQWGDEGKGRVVDFLTEDAEYVIRFNGGANAGHTIIVDGKKTVTHLLPSGIVRRGTRNVVGPGVVCSLDVLRDELDIAALCGAEVLLDRSTPVVHAIHRWFDAARESGGGIGTTKRGIGPAYEDVSSRRTVRLGDLTNADKVRAALVTSGYYAERRSAAAAYAGGATPLPPFPALDDVVGDIMSYKQDVVPLLCDARAVVSRAVAHGNKVLFEGAQGVMLDVYGGSSPHTTSSLCTLAGISATFGIYGFGPVIGVSKAYTTRVGEGPFPTELLDATGERLRELGHEIGATTGRPRRCGWLDIPALDYAIRMGGITHLVVTKLDTLSSFDPVRLCTSYHFEGCPIDTYETLTSRVLREAVPRYEEMPGWSDPSGVTDRASLPDAASDYLSVIEALTDRPVIAVGVGPERHQLAM